MGLNIRLIFCIIVLKLQYIPNVAYQRRLSVRSSKSSHKNAMAGGRKTGVSNLLSLFFF